jgi:hypothetical protein
MNINLLRVDTDVKNSIIIFANLKQDGTISQAFKIIVDNDPALFSIRIRHDHIFLLFSAFVRKNLC